MRWPRALWAWVVVASATACGDPSTGGPLTFGGREGRIEGTVELSDGARGDAWLFLYPPGSGPPLSAAIPDRVTAVSDVRIRERDRRYTFAQVEPNTYRLWGFLDTNRNFDPEIDVLAGPGAGDRIAEGVELNLQPGQALSVDLPVRGHVTHEPPAFRVANAEPDEVIQLSDQPSGVTSLELRVDPVGVLEATRLGFVVARGANADGVPEFFPRIYLRYLRKPGQVVPLDPKGDPAEVIIPFVFDPGPFLVTLAGDPSKEVVVDQLQAVMLPQAQAITFEPGRGRVVTPMDAIPVGDYELWVEHASGQFWRLPNGLGPKIPHQAQRFRVVHGGSGR